MRQVESKEFLADGKQDGGDQAAYERVAPLNAGVRQEFQEGAERQGQYDETNGKLNQVANDHKRRIAPKPPSNGLDGGIEDERDDQQKSHAQYEAE